MALVHVQNPHESTIIIEKSVHIEFIRYCITIFGGIGPRIVLEFIREASRGYCPLVTLYIL